MRVTSRGQVTIPKEIRDQAGIQPGTEIEFAVDNGRIVLFKRSSEETEADRRSRKFQEYLERVRGTFGSRDEHG